MPLVAFWSSTWRAKPKFDLVCVTLKRAQPPQDIPAPSTHTQSIRQTDVAFKSIQSVPTITTRFFRSGRPAQGVPIKGVVLHVTIRRPRKGHRER